MNQDEFIAKAKQQLDTWNAEVKKMRAEVEKTQAHGKEQLKVQLAKVEEQRDQLKTQIEKANEANMEAWKDMQTGFSEAWSAMEKGMTEARKRYSGD
jgi:chromosome segregation ATPase